MEPAFFRSVASEIASASMDAPTPMNILAAPIELGGL